MVITESDGVWAQAVGLRPPSAPTVAGDYEIAHLDSVSCTGVGDCVAVGDYKDAQDKQQGLLATEQGGTWLPTAEFALPANADTSGLPDGLVLGVACPASGSCLAVGSYFDTDQTEEAMVIGEQNGVWGPGTEAAVPSNAGSSPEASFNSVACPTAGSCVAVGSYQDAEGLNHAMVDVGSVDTTAVPPPPPPPTPTGVGATASDGAVTVSWTEPASSEHVDAFYITELGPGGTPLVSLPTIVSGDSTQTTITGLGDCEPYEFQVRAFGLGGFSAPALTGFVVPQWRPGGAPKVAVILMEGVDSPSYANTYYATGSGSPQHPSVSSYCYGSDGYVKTPFPSTLQALVNNFNPNNIPGAASSMTDALAGQGSVVLLPWSWGGAFLTADSYGPLMHVNAAPDTAANQLPIPLDASVLAAEVASVHSVWPQTKIVILAHSLGGLVAEQYWSNYWLADHEGVVRVIALDSPLNGLADIGPCELGPYCDHMSGFVTNFLANLWTNISSDDIPVSAADGDGSFLPVGIQMIPSTRDMTPAATA